MISSKLIELLRAFDLNILISGKNGTPERAASLGLQYVSLEELFEQSDVVSIHSPPTKDNAGLITGELVARMKPNATLINSSRGVVVCQQELVAVLRLRPDLIAVLDVTDPEPPLPNSELFTVPNIVLTPHIAGSTGRECRRMGDAMVAELERYLSGTPLRYEVTRELDFITGKTGRLANFRQSGAEQPTVREKAGE
jgi:phosphoglycerate dehydrogenase-like enzyme